MILEDRTTATYELWFYISLLLYLLYKNNLSMAEERPIDLLLYANKFILLIPPVMTEV